ncbi:MAG: DUF167 domain-containing protein [Chloroflexi bacterium]|nr:DUF167 domain-containing protein [Chloroflexota bacterium]
MSPRAVVCWRSDGALKVAVREPAQDGRATAAALRALSDALGVDKSAVRLISGAASRRKVVRVIGVTLKDLHSRISGVPADVAEEER